MRSALSLKRENLVGLLDDGALTDAAIGRV
jgi:hypothetical protein